MFSDDEFNPEKIGEQHKKPGEQANGDGEENEQNPEAERWEEAMGNDVPEFSGEWSYGPAQAEAAGDLSEVDNLSGANHLTSFGLDTASRLYGVGTIIKTILETDESERDVENPLGSIYERLAPTREAREYLYGEIRKERVRDNQHNQDPDVADDDDPKLGFTRSGDFYDKTMTEAGGQTSIDAIRAFKRLFAMLETSPRFADLRERAAAQGKTLAEYLVADDDNPTLTDFFNKVGTEISEEQVEELVDELEEEANPELAEEETFAAEIDEAASVDTEEFPPVAA